MSIVSTSWQLLNTKPHDDYGYCCGSPTVPTNCGRYGRCYKVGRLYGYVGGLCACRIPAESQLFAKTTWSNSKKIILSQILCVFHFLQNSMAKKVIPPFSHHFSHVYRGAEEKFSPGPGSTAKKTNLQAVEDGFQSIATLAGGLLSNY